MRARGRRLAVVARARTISMPCLVELGVALLWSMWRLISETTVWRLERTDRAAMVGCYWLSQAVPSLSASCSGSEPGGTLKEWPISGQVIPAY